MGMSVSPQITVINSIVRKMLDMLSQARHKNLKNEILVEIDELENQFDLLIQANAPERITDERFTAAVNAIHEVSEKIEQLRTLIVNERYKIARQKVLDLQASIRHAYRLLLLVRAGTPTPMIFQVSPQFLKEAELKPPEEIVFSSPMASQIYNIIVRKGKIPVEELAKELNVTDETRDEFNRALATLIQRGFVRPIVSSDNKLMFQAVR